jgi:predicted PurR-regulated permease PerM
MFDGITILIYPFFVIPIISIIFAYIIEYIRQYIHQRRREQNQLEYLSIIIILSSNEQNYPPPYETLLFLKEEM